MNFKTLIISILSMGIGASVQAATLTLDSTTNLAAQFELPRNNFHPQGLGYDESANELLFMQQSSKLIVRSDLSGNLVGTVGIDRNYSTSVAADATHYYYADYTGNASRPDLYAVNKTTGAETQLSSEVAAYGGYPIEVRDGTLYRTNISTFYSWGSFSTIRISDISAPDTVTGTVTLATSAGIGDFAVDSTRNEIWTIDFAGSASIRRFDLATGDLLDSFTLDLDGLTAGLTFANDKLYYYDWENGNSTLSAYSIGGVSPVPLPAGLPLLLAGLGGLALLRRRKA